MNPPPPNQMTDADIRRYWKEAYEAWRAVHYPSVQHLSGDKVELFKAGYLSQSAKIERLEAQALDSATRLGEAEKALAKIEALRASDVVSFKGSHGPTAVAIEAKRIAKRYFASLEGKEKGNG